MLWGRALKACGEAGGKGVRMGGHMCTRGWFTSMYSRNHHNIVIILQLKLINFKKEVYPKEILMACIKIKL